MCINVSSPGRDKPGELFHYPSPLSEQSLPSAPLEFWHHVIQFMAHKTQLREALTRQRAAQPQYFSCVAKIWSFTARQMRDKTSEKTF